MKAAMLMAAGALALMAFIYVAPLMTFEEGWHVFCLVVMAVYLGLEGIRRP